jgi:hypothetical protein
VSKDNNIQERLMNEVSRRVAFYEEHEPDESEKLSKIHYILAAAVAAIGLAMVIIGAM